MTPQLALELWHRAKNEEFGLVVKLATEPDKASFKEDMYKARTEAKDLSLSVLSICAPADNLCELMVVKQTVSLDDDPV